MLLYINAGEEPGLAEGPVIPLPPLPRYLIIANRTYLRASCSLIPAQISIVAF
jgi:hypothetical protein